MYIHKKTNGHTVSIRAVLLTVILTFSNILHAQANVLPAKLDRAIRDGNATKASELCSEVAFSAETPAEGARANAIMSILLFLNLDPDAESRAKSIGDFFIGTNNKDEKAAAQILDFLAGKISDRKLYKAIKGCSPDWKATAFIAMYVKTLHDSGIQPAKLNAYVKAYMAISKKMGSNSWGNVWMKRLVKWHNSLQNPLERADGLEKLIVNVREEATAPPIKKQLTTLNKIFNLLLKGDKNSAMTAIKKASAGTEARKSRPYAQILAYLSGELNDTSDIYDSCSKNPELYLMTSLAAFLKNLTNSKPGDLQKNVLLSYLNKYSKNVSKAHQQDATKWKDTVENWKQWCSSNFPDSSELPPLLATHSKAIVDMKQIVAKHSNALKLYNKIRNVRNLNRISMKDFKEERQMYQARPRPASLDFSSNEVKRYIATLPREVQRGEWHRFVYVRTFKANLIQDLNFSQYKGTIRVKDQSSGEKNITSYKAQVIEANENYITIKVGHSKKRLKWSSLPVGQLITFASSYIRNNIGGKNARSNIFSSTTATEKALSKEYRNLALFCDWYEKYNRALMFAKQADALKYDNGTTRQLLLW